MNTLRLPTLMLISILLAACGEPVEPDEQFVKVHFHYGFRNELNTFEHNYQKDLVMDGVATTEFWLTTTEQEALLIKATQCGFFDLPDTIIQPWDTVMVVIDPNPGPQFLRLQHEAQDHLVTWFYPLPEDTVYLPRLIELAVCLIDLIESKQAYKSLPPARGGYI
ncbi:MAG: hypothetical protein JSW54_02075 [Fidelibacterota bacterium]|nr:MAG: hypothetical protein JSW54_02075 [Candidatus Neomarinimicrobiota bacterium]